MFNAPSTAEQLAAKRRKQQEYAKELALQAAGEGGRRPKNEVQIKIGNPGGANDVMPAPVRRGAVQQSPRANYVIRPMSADSVRSKDGVRALAGRLPTPSRQAAIGAGGLTALDMMNVKREQEVAEGDAAWKGYMKPMMPRVSYEKDGEDPFLKLEEMNNLAPADVGAVAGRMAMLERAATEAKAMVTRLEDRLNSAEMECASLRAELRGAAKNDYVARIEGNIMERVQAQIDKFTDHESAEAGRLNDSVTTMRRMWEEDRQSMHRLRDWQQEARQALEVLGNRLTAAEASDARIQEKADGEHSQLAHVRATNDARDADLRERVDVLARRMEHTMADSVEAMRAATEQKLVDVQEKVMGLSTALGARIREAEGEIQVRTEEFRNDVNRLMGEVQQTAKVASDGQGFIKEIQELRERMDQQTKENEQQSIQLKNEMQSVVDTVRETMNAQSDMRYHQTEETIRDLQQLWEKTKDSIQAMEHKSQASSEYLQDVLRAEIQARVNAEERTNQDLNTLTQTLTTDFVRLKEEFDSQLKLSAAKGKAVTKTVKGVWDEIESIKSESNAKSSECLSTARASLRKVEELEGFVQNRLQQEVHDTLGKFKTNTDKIEAIKQQIIDDKVLLQNENTSLKDSFEMSIRNLQHNIDHEENKILEISKRMDLFESNVDDGKVNDIAVRLKSVESTCASLGNEIGNCSQQIADLHLEFSEEGLRGGKQNGPGGVEGEAYIEELNMTVEEIRGRLESSRGELFDELRRLDGRLGSVETVFEEALERHKNRLDTSVGGLVSKVGAYDQVAQKIQHGLSALQDMIARSREEVDANLKALDNRVSNDNQELSQLRVQHGQAIDRLSKQRNEGQTTLEASIANIDKEIKQTQRTAAESLDIASQKWASDINRVEKAVKVLADASEHRTAGLESSFREELRQCVQQIDDLNRASTSKANQIELMVESKEMNLIDRIGENCADLRIVKQSIGDCERRIEEESSGLQRARKEWRSAIDSILATEGETVKSRQKDAETNARKLDDASQQIMNLQQVLDELKASVEQLDIERNNERRIREESLIDVTSMLDRLTNDMAECRQRLSADSGNGSTESTAYVSSLLSNLVSQVETSAAVESLRLDIMAVINQVESHIGAVENYQIKEILSTQYSSEDRIRVLSAKVNTIEEEVKSLSAVERTASNSASSKDEKHVQDLEARINALKGDQVGALLRLNSAEQRLTNAFDEVVATAVHGVMDGMLHMISEHSPQPKLPYQTDTVNRKEKASVSAKDLEDIVSVMSMQKESADEVAEEMREQMGALRNDVDLLMDVMQDQMPQSPLLGDGETPDLNLDTIPEGTSEGGEGEAEGAAESAAAEENSEITEPSITDIEDATVPNSSNQGAMESTGNDST